MAKLKIVSYELYVDDFDDLERVKDFLLLECKDTYATEYRNKKTAFIKAGFLGYTIKNTKAIIRNLRLEIKINKVVKMIPPLWHMDVELTKFIAADLYRSIHKVTSKYKKEYQSIESRQFNDLNYPIEKEEMTEFSALDYVHLFHHLFNFMDKGYEDELYIYDRAKGIIDLTWKKHNTK